MKSGLLMPVIHPILCSIPGFIEDKRQGSIEYSGKTHARSNMAAKEVTACGYASIIHKTHVESCTLAAGASQLYRTKVPHDVNQI
jgi:hypothetical protein